MSSPRPGSGTIRGAMPSARAAAQWDPKLSWPKAKGSAAGRRAEHAVGAAPVVRRHQGHGWYAKGRLAMARQHRRDFLDARPRHVAGHLEQAVDTGARQRNGGPGHGRTLAVVGGFGEHPRPMTGGERGRPLVAGHHDDLGQSRHLGESLQHVLDHRHAQQATLVRAENARQPLLGIAEILDRKDRPDRHIVIPWAIPWVIPWALPRRRQVACRSATLGKRPIAVKPRPTRADPNAPGQVEADTRSTILPFGETVLIVDQDHADRRRGAPSPHHEIDVVGAGAGGKAPHPHAGIARGDQTIREGLRCRDRAGQHVRFPGGACEVAIAHAPVTQALFVQCIEDRLGIDVVCAKG